MALADYEQLAARSFDEPHDRELRAAVLVCADALSQEGDPRGPLIVMEHALRDADHRRAVELRRAIHEYAAGEGAALLGAAAPLMHARRTLALDWRSGRLFGMTIDARYLPRTSKISPGELVRRALLAPAASYLRRLRVRVRDQEDSRSISEMLRLHPRPPPLEELELYIDAWPRRMVSTSTTFLQDALPHLYFAVSEHATLSLAPEGVLHRNPATEIDRYLPELASCAAPTTSQPARTFLGRCVTHGNPELRVAALERVAQLGPRAQVFEHALCTLLQPGIAGPPVGGNTTSAPHPPLVRALVAIRPSRRGVEVLAKIASRPEVYDAETRKLAGSAVAMFRR